MSWNDLISFKFIRLANIFSSNLKFSNKIIVFTMMGSSMNYLFKIPTSFYCVSYYQTYKNDGVMNAVLVLSKVGHSSESVIS